MSYKDFDKNEPTDDIDRLFQANEQELPLAGRAFEETLRFLQAETANSFDQTPLQLPLPRRKVAAFSFGSSSVAAAFTIVAVSGVIALLLLVGLWLTSPTAPNYTLSADTSSVATPSLVATAPENTATSKSGVLPDGSRAFPQYIDYTQARRESKSPVSNSAELDLPSLLVPQLDRFGDNTTQKALPPTTYRRQMG